MVKRCDFLLGDNNSIIIIIPGYLPAADTYTVSISQEDIKFKAGYDKIATLPYDNAEVYSRIANATQIGLVEHDEQEPLPNYITNIAYVEVRRAGEAAGGVA